MTIGLCFWICMLIWLIFGVYSGRAGLLAGDYRVLGGTVLEFFLFFLLGWQAFGFPLHR